ncbi:hypothetical protein [Pyxidicoccus caerfyrddinensis]|uniref:hypothetical protein n=1 Tax=Pyxidicoccus caerfyrddinensis TaxID=2709663 RepID=UPI0013DC80BD|nr:hypothetical protein [Pyxidicoccus caerfyrddinensis]
MFSSMGRIQRSSARNSLVALLLGLAAILPGEAGAQTWQTLLDDTASLASWSHMTAFDDGSAALVSRDYLPGNTGAGVFFRKLQGGSWSAPERIDGGLPTYNGRTAEVMGRVFVGSANKASLGAAPVTVVITARYSRTILDADGLMYALFMKRWNGFAWSGWTRITPVGIVNDVSADVDGQGRVWYTWNDGDNRANGQYRLSSYDPATACSGAVHTLDTASRTLTWRSTSLVIAPDAIWVTYRAPDGIYARRLANQGAGPLGPRLSVQLGFPSGQMSAWVDGTLWVTTESPLRLYRMSSSGSFIQEPISGLTSYYEETESSIESIDHYLPVVAQRPGSGLVLIAARQYHFEDWVNPGNDFDESSLVAVERSSAGTWSGPVTLEPDESWSEIGNAASTSAAGLFIGGTKASGAVFVLRRLP